MIIFSPNRNLLSEHQDTSNGAKPFPDKANNGRSPDIELKQRLNYFQRGAVMLSCFWLSYGFHQTDIISKGRKPSQQYWDS